MKDFWTNLKGIAINSPLVLSDTYNVKDISINRIAQAALLIAALAIIYEIARTPSLSPQLIPVLERVLTILGVQLAANTLKRAIDTYKKVTAAPAADQKEEV